MAQERFKFPDGPKGFRRLATGFLIFKHGMDALVSFIDDSEDSISLKFANLIFGFGKNDDISKEEVNNAFEEFDEDSRIQIISKLKDGQFNQIREFGKEIEFLYPDNFKANDYYKIDKDLGDIVVFCSSIPGHLNEFFKLVGPTTPKKKLELIYKFYNFNKTKNGLLEYFGKILKIISVNYEFERITDEDNISFAARCLYQFVGRESIRLTSQREVLVKQLETLKWKDYVSCDGRMGNEVDNALAMLKKFRHYNNRHVLQIIGKGGLGKTKLTYEFTKFCLHSDNANDQFDQIIILTAKSDQQGEMNYDFSDTSRLSPRDPTLAVGRHVKDLNYDDTMNYLFALSNTKDEAQLLREFSINRYLIVLDNFETASKESISKFYDFFMRFENATSIKSKLLITGRTKEADAHNFFVLELQRLNQEQAILLMQKKYDHEFKQMYGTNEDRNQSTIIYGDFRKSINSNLIQRIKDELKKNSHDDVARDAYFGQGVLHPGMLFYFISMIMDRKLYDEYRKRIYVDNEKDIEFSKLIAFVVNHEKYGIHKKIEEIDEWISEHSTSVIKDDDDCTSILKFMLQDENKFYDLDMLIDEMNSPNEVLQPSKIEAAFKKLDSHEKFETKIEDGKKRLTSASRFVFTQNADPTEKESNAFIDTLVNILDKKEELENIVHLIPEKFDNHSMNPKIFGHVAKIISKLKIRGDKSDHYVKSAVSKLEKLYVSIYNSHYPNDTSDWSKDTLKNLLGELGVEDLSSSLSKSELVQKAHLKIQSDNFEFSTSSNKFQNKLNDLSEYFLSFISVLDSPNELEHYLAKFDLKLRKDITLSPFLIRSLEIFVEKDDGLSGFDVHKFIKLIPVLTENIDQCSNILISFVSQLLKTECFSTVENFRKLVSVTGYSIEDFTTSFNDIISNDVIRSELRPPHKTVQMIDFFDLMKTQEAEYPFDEDLEKTAIYTEILNLHEPIESFFIKAERIRVTDEMEEEVSFDPGLRCFLLQKVDGVGLYTFFQTKFLRHSLDHQNSKEDEEKNGKFTVNNEPIYEAIKHFIGSTKLTHLYKLDIVNHLKHKFELNAILHSLATSLPSILEEINDELVKEVWVIIYSPTKKDLITAIEKREIKSQKGEQSERNSRSNAEIWFERKPKGMYADNDKAKAVTDEILLELNEFHKTKSAYLNKLQYAIKFSQKKQNFWKNYLNTSMRFNAAFHTYDLSNIDIESIINGFERELKRQVNLEKSYSPKKELNTFNHEWIANLRQSYGIKKNTQNTNQYTNQRKKNNLSHKKNVQNKTLEDEDWYKNFEQIMQDLLRKEEEKYEQQRREQEQREDETKRQKEQELANDLDKFTTFLVEKQTNNSDRNFHYLYESIWSCYENYSNWPRVLPGNWVKYFYYTIFTNKKFQNNFGDYKTWNRLLIEIKELFIGGEYKKFNVEKSSISWPLIEFLFKKIGYDDEKLDWLRVNLDEEQ